MDIHKPKPWHGPREFLKEYLIIVVGVLTALAGEQAVEWGHHRAEVQEARRALDAEVGFDLASFDFTLDQAKCMDQRIAELARWRASWDAGRPLKLIVPLPTIPAATFRTSVWRVASVAAVAQMPFEARVDYGKFYDGIANADGDRGGEFDLWRDLSRLARDRRLNDDQLAQVDDDLDRLRSVNEALASRVRFIPGYAQALNVKPTASAYARFKANFGEKLARFCKPILLSDTSR